MAQPSRILRLHYPQLVKPTAPISPGYPRRAFGFSFMIRFKSSRISSLDLLVWKDKAGVSKLAASETNIATLAHQLEWCSQVIKFVNLLNLCEIPSEWARGIEVWNTHLHHISKDFRETPFEIIATCNCFISTCGISVKVNGWVFNCGSAVGFVGWWHLLWPAPGGGNSDFLASKSWRMWLALSISLLSSLTCWLQDLDSGSFKALIGFWY